MTRTRLFVVSAIAACASPAAAAAPRQATLRASIVGWYQVCERQWRAVELQADRGCLPCAARIEARIARNSLRAERAIVATPARTDPERRAKPLALQGFAQWRLASRLLRRSLAELDAGRGRAAVADSNASQAAAVFGGKLLRRSMTLLRRAGLAAEQAKSETS